MAVTVDARRALLGHLIDDAGLFPPAQLPMPRALDVDRHARSGPYGWVVGPFVVPASRLGELTQTPPSLSVILDGAVPGDHWLAGVRGELATIAARASDRVASCEVRVDPAAIDAALPALAGAPGRIFLEFARTAQWIDDCERVARACLAVDGDERRFALKLRTGGLVAAAFPSADELASALLIAARHGVAVKATAGLHHPIRADRDGLPMHGFLNILVAACLIVSGERDSDAIASVLDDADARAFSLDGGALAYRGKRYDAVTIAHARERLFLSFGSCSIAEPLDDLRELDLIA